MKNGVYKIRNIVNDHCYIGSCAHKNGFPLRWSNHRRALRNNKHHSIILQRAWNKYGESNFKFEVMEECEPVKCIGREQYYLDTMHPEYNVLKIAGSSLGRKMSPDQIQKMKDRSYDWMKGDRNWNKSPERREFYRQRIKTQNLRQYLTAESFRKISEFHKGKPKSEIQKQRMSEASLGRPKSKEHVEKMKAWARENNSGDKAYFHTHKFIFRGKDSPGFSGYYKFRNKITNEEIVCAQFEFVNKFQFDSGRVSAICLGKRKSHKGWMCMGKENS
jgi:group I intron endonuclease